MSLKVGRLTSSRLFCRPCHKFLNMWEKCLEELTQSKVSLQLYDFVQRLEAAYSVNDMREIQQFPGWITRIKWSMILVEKQHNVFTGGLNIVYFGQWFAGRLGVALWRPWKHYCIIEIDINFTWEGLCSCSTPRSMQASPSGTSWFSQTLK